MNISLSPFAPENLVSRDGFGSPVPRQPAHLHTQAESVNINININGAYLFLTGFLPISAAASIYLYRHTPSDQSRVDWVMQLRTHGVHCRESAGTGPVVPSVVPILGAALTGHHGPNNMPLSFPPPTNGMKWAC